MRRAVFLCAAFGAAGPVAASPQVLSEASGRVAQGRRWRVAARLG
ncbi:MAG: hypothetical protein ABIT83_17175 [Massilia sp.]